jgi:hypothetical protein
VPNVDVEDLRTAREPTAKAKTSVSFHEQVIINIVRQRSNSAVFTRHTTSLLFMSLSIVGCFVHIYTVNLQK